MKNDGEPDPGPALADVLSGHFERLVGLAGGPTKAARELAVSRTTLDKWMKGESRIPLEAAVKIASLAGKPLDWLVSGKDETGGQLQVQSFGSPMPDGFVAVPALEVRASAGAGAVALAQEAEGTDIVAFREAWLRSIGLIPGRVHILWATGDSMSPTIRDGDMLLVDRTIDRVVNDGIYVVVAAGAVRVKRIYMRQNGSVVLRSDNERYPEEIIPADEVPQLVVEGRVRWVGGPI